MLSAEQAERTTPMTLALVQALVAIVLTLIATWTCLLVSTALLLPNAASRSEHLITTEPWKCFSRGLGVFVLLIIGIVSSSNGPGITRIFGFGLFLFAAAVIAVGSTGVALTIGKRGEPDSEAPTFRMLVRGSLVSGIAFGFPVVGWFVFAPIALITAGGAGILSLMRQRRANWAPPSAPGTPDYDLSAHTGAIS